MAEFIFRGRDQNYLRWKLAQTWGLAPSTLLRHIRGSFPDLQHKQLVEEQPGGFGWCQGMLSTFWIPMADACTSQPPLAPQSGEISTG